jgi:hypothetical protein
MHFAITIFVLRKKLSVNSSTWDLLRTNWETGSSPTSTVFPSLRNSTIGSYLLIYHPRYIVLEVSDVVK